MKIAASFVLASLKVLTYMEGTPEVLALSLFAERPF
jgi:hypothetical protein